MSATGAIEVIMPALGVAQETGRIVEWIVGEGQTVQAGDPLLEIETDKVTVSIEAPASGVLSSVRAGDGDDVPVGSVIALIVAPGEEVPGPAAAEPEPPAAAGAEPAAAATAEPATATEREGGPERSAGAVPAPSGAGTRASPLARRRAREAGIDLSELAGTGPDGAVTVADLEAALAARTAPERAEGADGERVAVSPLWRRMAERVTASWAAPHFYVSSEVDAERLIAWRATLDEGVTVTDLLVWLCARALRRHPEVNAVWDGDGPRRIGEVNVGIAVAVDDGLVVPVVHGADELSVAEVAERRRDVVERARAEALEPDDVRGGTFTVTNLGMFGVDSFAAIVNGPQAAILAVGRVSERVVAVEGQAAVRSRMDLTLSCDHRMLDGVRGARFLQTVAGFVEEPLQLIPSGDRAEEGRGAAGMR